MDEKEKTSDLTLCWDNKNIKPISSRGCNKSINIIAYHKAVLICSYW